MINIEVTSEEKREPEILSFSDIMKRPGLYNSTEESKTKYFLSYGGCVFIVRDGFIGLPQGDWSRAKFTEFRGTVNITLKN